MLLIYQIYQLIVLQFLWIKVCFTLSFAIAFFKSDDQCTRYVGIVRILEIYSLQVFVIYAPEPISRFANISQIIFSNRIEL